MRLKLRSVQFVASYTRQLDLRLFMSRDTRQHCNCFQERFIPPLVQGSVTFCHFEVSLSTQSISEVRSFTT